MNKRIGREDRFGAVHLTLVSMVQAIALEMLVSKVGSVGLAGTGAGLVFWVQAAGILATIFWLWLWYSTLVISFQWHPTMTDVLFPFWIGVAQFTVIGFLGTDSVLPWLAVATVGYAIGGVVFQGTVQRVARDSRNAAQRDGIDPVRVRTITVLCFCVSGSLGVGSLLLVLSYPLASEVLMIVADVAIVGIVVAWASMWGRLVSGGESVDSADAA